MAAPLSHPGSGPGVPAGGGGSGRPPRRSLAGLLATVGLGGAVVLAVVAGLVLFDPGREAEQQRPEQPAARSAEQPSPARGVTAGEVVLGMASPFSGANRELGRGMKAGLDAAFAEVNAAGGIHGRKLRLVSVDDGYEPTRTGPAMKQLLEVDRVFAVVGNVGTPTAAVAIPICAQHQAVFLGALSGSEILRNDPPDRWVFNFRPSYAEETAAAVRWLVDVRRIPPERIAVFAQEDGFGESGWEGVARQLRKRKVDPSAVLRVGYKRNSADVSEAIAKVKRRAGDLDAVVMIATYKAAATFIRALRDAGLGVVTTNVSPVDSNALAEELVASGAPYTDGVVVTQVVPLPTSPAPGVIRFRAALEEHLPGERPGFLALEGWIVGHLLAEGLRRAGADVDPEKLVAALESIRELDLGIGTTISFGPREHQGSHKVWGTMLQRDGSWRQIDLE